MVIELKIKSRLLIILVSIGFLISIPHAYASESFHGTSSFENVPSEISRHFPSTFEIKFQYTVGPWGLSHVIPVIEIVPENASSQVQLDFEPTHVQKNSVARIPVTITVDRTMDYEKIFLSVSFEGNGLSDIPFKSGWTDSLILSIGSRDEIEFLVDHEIIPWDDFENEFQEDAAIFKNNLAGLGILEAGTEYYIVQKAEFTASSFGDKDTKVNATIGYAIQPGDQMLRPPMHENATDAEHEEFMQKVNKQREEFPRQSTIGNLYDFIVDVENPFYIQFPFIIEESGQYTRQFYKKTHIFEGPAGSGMGGLVVVDKFSKAVDENAQCNNEEFRRLIKHDYSTVVCVDSETAWKLIGRGWGI